MFTQTRRFCSKSISPATVSRLLCRGDLQHQLITILPTPVTDYSLSFMNMRSLQHLTAFMLQQSDNYIHRHHFVQQFTTTSCIRSPITTDNISRRFISLHASKLEPIDKTRSQSKTARRMRRQRRAKAKRKREQSKVALPTHGPNGRPIVTKAILENDPFLASLPYDLRSSNPKTLLNGVTKHKLQYVQHVAFDTVGPPGDHLFLATITTSFEYQNATKELVCSGMGRTKKLAEFFAAIDLIAALKECNIDAENPPDIKALREQRDEEKFQADVAKAQMLLELFDSSRPKFIVEKVKKGWQATVSLWVQGEYFTVLGPVGKNKAKSEGLALVELVSGNNELTEFFNAREDSTEQYMQIIDSSPGKHIAALRIDPLPHDIAQDMVDIIGTDDGRHEERMRNHNTLKAEYEDRFGVGGRRPRSRRQRNASTDYNRINKELRKEEEQRVEILSQNPEGKHAQMKSFRENLPITAIRQDLLNALQTDQVVVVSGGTGSGKSTQCPQYILEDALLSCKGANTEIIVTQPRKIAAVSVADRVANERHEEIGNSIGYTVRFHRKPPREAGGTIEFVTTGVLLNRIMNDPLLNGVSHVMIDEVHERDINTDFLLILLRDLLRKRHDLRVVLMSATLNPESFAKYFSTVNTNKKCQHLSVPTQPRHPVDVFYLEDMVSMKQDVQDLAVSLLQYHDQKLRIELEEAESEVLAAQHLETRANDEDEGLLLDSDSDDDSDGESEYVPSTTASRVKTLRRAVLFRNDKANTTFMVDKSLHAKALTKADEREAGETIIKLMSKLALHLSKNEIDAGRRGSILCFLPGWDEIKVATALLEEESSRDIRDKIQILPLHSTIPQDDQQKVFIPAEEGTMKIILATNIAESSVTINDVLAVVDGGLVRELNWDAESAMSTMETVGISQASATQRLGRAGRVAPGVCYRLYSRGAYEAMPERPCPEIQRTALEATCLQTCSIHRQEGVEKFLSQAMDPPQSDAISFALERLTKVGAIRVNDNSHHSRELLTPLGRVLSRLPLDPSTGRMLIMGVLMRCLGPVVTAAACFSSRSVFYNPPGLRDEAQEIRRSFSSSSDTTAQINAYNEFWGIVNAESWDDACEWAQENFVSISAMISIKAVRSQLLNELKKIGFVDNSDLEKVGRNEFNLRADANANWNADNELLHNAVLASSIPGNISSRRQLGNFGTLRTRTEGHAEIHPSSVSFYRKPPKGTRLAKWYLYREMVLSSQVFLRECSEMRPEQLLLFGGYSLDTFHRGAHPVHILDDWIVAESQCDETIRILTSARKEIEIALEHKVMHPRHPLPVDSQDAIDGICDMFDALNYGQSYE